MSIIEIATKQYFRGEITFAHYQAIIRNNTHLT